MEGWRVTSEKIVEKVGRREDILDRGIARAKGKEK